jgi:hypothetical protein
LILGACAAVPAAGRAEERIFGAIASLESRRPADDPVTIRSVDLARARAAGETLVVEVFPGGEREYAPSGRPDRVDPTGGALPARAMERPALPVLPAHTLDDRKRALEHLRYERARRQAGGRN